MSNENESKIIGKSIILAAIIIGCFFFFGNISTTNHIVEINDTVQKVNVTNDPLNVSIVSPLESNNAIPVNIQDQHSEVIDLKLMLQIANVTLLDNYNIGDKFVNVSTIITPIVGNVLCLKSRTTDAFLQDEIINVISLGGNNYQLELQMPLDFAFTINDGCSHGSTNWAVDGSITPQIFKVSPILNVDGTRWDITRIIWECIGDGMETPGDPTPDDTAFFVMDPLTNGAYLRTINGITKNIFAAKDNSNMIIRMYDLDINTVLNKNGFYSTKARRTFSGQDKNGVTLRLNSDTGDSVEWVIQDDLTDMEKCEAVVQGHIVQD